MSRALIEEEIPKLKSSNYRITSPRTGVYNCIAWATSCTTRWWWPDKYGFSYWPESVAREETISAFLAAFESLGYEKCEDGILEAGYEKIALFADPDTGVPTHAARQLSDGWWTSKLGQMEDIEHKKVEDIRGSYYGEVVCFMRRQKLD